MHIQQKRKGLFVYIFAKKSLTVRTICAIIKLSKGHKVLEMKKPRIPTIGKREGKESERYGRIDCAVCDCI